MTNPRRALGQRTRDPAPLRRNDASVGPDRKLVEISLVDRKKMIHRMLLGRATLAGPFMVDVDRHLALGPKKRRRAGA